MSISKTLAVHKEYFKIALKTAAEYRMNFIIQVFSMLLNDIMWIVFWLLFFNKFKNIGGWEINDMLLLYSIMTIAYGITGVFYGNRSKIAGVIAQGKLDFYLTLPKNVLYHVLMSRVSWYPLGDIICGIILACIALPFAKLPLFLVLIISSSVTFLAFTIIAGSVSFYAGSGEQISESLRFATLAASSYPLSIYKDSIVKFIILFIIPAGLMTGVPVEILKNFDMKWFIGCIFFAALFLIISIVIFYKGLKKYESGNQITVRS